MLTFGNTYLNFGGAYLSGWRGNTNPLKLPSYTTRLLFRDNAKPVFTYGTGVQVSQSPNIWDLTYENNDWTWLLYQQYNLIEVLGANTTGVTNMKSMFAYCYLLTSVSLFDTSNVTNTNGMFNNCQRLTSSPLFDTSNVTNICSMFEECVTLTSIPLFDTSKVENMGGMFKNCHMVEKGALALYKQASTQANPPTIHPQTFRNCGVNTQTGKAELAQIPSDWK